MTGFTPTQLHKSASTLSDSQESRLLIIDDDADLRALLLRKFRAEGFHVDEASSVHMATERLYEAAYDLIILDLMMVPESGYVLFDFLKSDPKFKWIPLIVLSGHQDLDEKVKCLELGADDYVTKPFQFRELKARVGRMLTRAREYEHIAFRDALTGVYNRRYFDNYLAVELQKIQRTHASSTLVLLDIDRFKGVNDTYGHPIGDLVLQGMAHLLKENLRQSDFVARFGGEEFVIMLGGASEREAMRVMNELLGKVREHVMAHVEDQQIRITFSGGLAAWEPGVSRAEWISRADQMLYAAKQAGRNQCAGWSQRGSSDTPEEASEAGVPQRLPLVLVVDESKMMHAILTAKLAELSLQTVSVTQREAAIAFVQEHEVDLCIMDASVPNLRSLSKRKNIKIFAITDHAQEKERLAAGFTADERMAKPFSLVELEMRLKKLMFVDNG
ncbi:diguanylate cyclase [Paenibacillus aestuarii]|uniref:diguanylate cyclase n=1 Tax=Paenibacillus aestuarii TaxID=516965 RepID=UPI0022EA0254|nr:diguanylate cyclase [Paenibacillus aestuarii]